MDANANQNQKVTCVAIYPYSAVEPDELTLRVGDVVRSVERLPGGWWRGELRGRQGMFPDNFVTPLTEHASVRSGGVAGRCRAVFSYQPANPDELTLAVGDVLDVLGEVEEGWWQGRKQGAVGVFPSNFVVMLDGLGHGPAAATTPQPAPKLPPKPVKELCRVLFPYTAVNEDELTLNEGDIVTILSKEAPDRGWWRGELRGRQGLFPDNFVQLIASAQDAEEKKPERPPSKTTNSIYPILNKYSEKTASMKELSTSKISLHKENTLSKESSIQSSITHTNKSESEKLIHSETVTDGTLDGQVKKPPVPTKKSPTPTSGVGGLFSGLKSKMLSSDKDKTSTPPSTNNTECDRLDGAASTKPSTNSTNTNNTLDCVERNSILNDPRAARVKAPRRRPPSQALRDDAVPPQPPVTPPLSNGHEATPEQLSSDKTEEIKPRAREWEKHRAPWMEELKLNQARKGDGKGNGKGGSTDRLLECGIEEKKSSSQSMEMSKSTSSISNRISVIESFEEPMSGRPPSDPPAPPLPGCPPPAAVSPTAAGRTLSTMLDDIKRPSQSPPAASARTHSDHVTSTTVTDKSAVKLEKTSHESSHKSTEEHYFAKLSSSMFDKSGSVERTERVEERSGSGSAPDRRLRRDSGHSDEMIAQLSNRILNLEKLLEVQNAKWTAAIEDLSAKLAAEVKRREALQAELGKLAHCVTQV